MNVTKKQDDPGMRKQVPLALGGLLVALSMPACASHVSVPEAIQTCPCANGAFCCSSGVCAPNANGCDAATAALSNSVEGQWQGYFENFALSTDDSLTISIVVADDGTMSGHVTIGQSPPPAPATDPDAPWPPGLNALSPSGPGLPRYIPGFAYEAHHVRWEAQRLRFEIGQNEPWQPWCQLQTAYPLSDGQYRCIPGEGGGMNVDTDPQCFTEDIAGNVIGEVPCFKLYLMCVPGTPCACEADGCAANLGAVYTFDIALHDGVGDGSSSLTDSPIRLNQVSHP
jgi:hypothetical protein